MKQKIINAIKHPLISNTFIVIIGGLAASVCNFLFNLFMTRNLSVVDYGVLASLLSLFSLAQVLAQSLTPMIVQFAGEYIAKKQTDLLKGLLIKVTTWYFFIGLGLIELFFLFNHQISSFFHITNTTFIILCGIAILFSFIYAVNTSILQAKLSFFYLSITQLLGMVIKLLLGAGLVILGFGVGGSMWALIVALLVPFLLNFVPLRFLFSKHLVTPKINMKELFFYGLPSAVAMFGITSFISTDILLVKHFFPPAQASLYAGLSLVGRVIFFLTAPIGMVMFPLIVQKHAKKESYTHFFLLSLLFVLIPSVFVNIFYFLFPEFTIHFFFKKKEYLAVIPYLGIFGVYITLYSLTVIMTNFYLSIKKTSICIPIIITALAQAIGIWLWHSTFWQVIWVSMSSLGILFIMHILYYFSSRK